MKYLINAICWLLLAIIMVGLAIVNIASASWWLLPMAIIAFIMDIVNAGLNFSRWARWLGVQEAQKENKNDT